MTSFDDIRPYQEEEIPTAMQRLADNNDLPTMLHHILPDADAETIINKIRSIRTSEQFQAELMVKAVEGIMHKTASNFSWSGLENISDKRPCLFVSNHRDIVLDAMLLQYILLTNGHKTCYIAFGNNLMFNSLFVDFWKVNKMFQIGRGGHPKDFYNSLLHMSEYIRHLITEEHESVWIAQRNGRTKNGLDSTDPTILKMFGMSQRDDRVFSLSELNIVPVTVSYEWEPCDKMKTLECYAKQLNGSYEKQPGEDLKSVLTGVTQQKGHVHFHISPAITETNLKCLNDYVPTDFYRKVAQLIDNRIYANYRLYPNHYIAHDLRSGTETYAQHYTDEEKARFLQYMTWIDQCQDMDHSVLKSLFLGIYANPIDSLNNSK